MEGCEFEAHVLYMRQTQIHSKYTWIQKYKSELKTDTLESKSNKLEIENKFLKIPP